MSYSSIFSHRIDVLLYTGCPVFKISLLLLKMCDFNNAEYLMMIYSVFLKSVIVFTSNLKITHSFILFIFSYFPKRTIV